MPRVGVVGSLVWDLIHGRDPLAPPTEEWGGIAYALGGLDASLPPEWEIVPLIKVGRDLAAQRDEQVVAGHGDSAAHHHDFGIEDVEQVADADAEKSGGVVHDLEGRHEAHQRPQRQIPLGC